MAGKTIMQNFVDKVKHLRQYSDMKVNGAETIKTVAGGSTAKVPAQQSQYCASVEVTVKTMHKFFGFGRCACHCEHKQRQFNLT